MILKKRIPVPFYKLFRTRNMDAYMQFLVAIYEENNEEYATAGLTSEECKAIIAETISKSHIAWELDETEEEDAIAIAGSPTFILNRLVEWGWLYSDFDEKLNCYVLSFPEYSQLYVELFQKLQSEDDSRERESILSIYSALFTYHKDEEKNNDILRNALLTSKRLGQLLSNMQDGMRNYFEELSTQKDFRGIQEVLISEINNSDSKKYAILTTTDSFYRYKEEVKELIDQILVDSDERRSKLDNKKINLTDVSENRKDMVRLERMLELCEESVRLVHQIEREFDVIERKYNHLVEQKAIFAKRALARIHYILQEDNAMEDNIVMLINLLDRSHKKEEIVEELQKRIKISMPYKNVTDSSIYNRKVRNENDFEQQPLPEIEEELQEDMSHFVPKPLYTKKQLQEFKEKNMHNGVFETTQSTVETIDDLEKLLFLWQEATNIREEGDKVSVQEELHSADGLTFSKLIIK